MELEQGHEQPVGTALVADDDNDFRQLLARRARRMGLTVVEVDNGSRALEAVALTRALEHRHLLRENARLFQEVQRLAITDPLTGLYNRHKLAEALETECERAVRYGRPVSMIMMDLDDLKLVNDTLGHPGGDVVLQKVAEAIRGHIRRLDLPTRYGGDEFLVLLPETSLVDAERVAQRISHEVRKIRAGELPVTASVGVVDWGSGYRSSQEFLSAADQALYLAKRRGGGAIVIQTLAAAAG